MIHLNLDEISDELEGRWWLEVRTSDFGFLEQIPDVKECEVDNDDILIHKQRIEGERFPMIRYHLIMDGEPLQLQKKDLNDTLAEHLVNYIKEKKKFPFACTLEKLQKNGEAVVKYKPGAFDEFTIKIDPENYKIEDPETFFNNLETESTNALNPAGAEAFTIKPLKQAPVISQVASESGGSVCVTDAEILEIDQRKSVFQEHVTTFYIMHVKGGTAAPDTKKSTLQREFEEINVKCSENAMTEFKLQKGDKISFKGKLNNDRKAGLLIQNIRKFEKS